MKKVNIKKIYKYVRDPKNKPVLFFGFYFVLFVCLAVLFRIAPSTTTPKTNLKAKPKSSHYYNLGKLEDANYHFKYYYNIDGAVANFEGDRNGVRQLFIRNYNNTIDNFYGYRNLFMINSNNDWIKSDNPYLYSEFLEVDVIREILKKATFISKTEYQNKKYSYTYNISTTTLDKIINNNIIDIEDPVNEVVITMDNNYYVEKIEYKLDSFIKYQNPISHEFKLNLEFSEFGNIKEIQEPKQ